MPGISSVLNIAKEALLTHQASVNVSGHNIANVNTPGYSRQILDLTTPIASPDPTGFFGNGVKSDSITRQYDQFMVKRLTDQNSTIKNLEAMQQSLRVVETIFNEAPGLAVNDMLSKFWETWQELTNNPELSSSRQTVVQQAQLLSEQMNIMSDEIINTRNEISVSLKSSIDTLNSLTSQIASINTQITAAETERQQQNDLRDSRDLLLRELSGLVDINYFETSTGAYTVMLSDGHTLVEKNEHWSVDWTSNKLYWVSENSQGTTFRTEIKDSASVGGSIGGLLETSSQLAEGDPGNYMGRLNALANSLIREVNQQHVQGVGTTQFSDILNSSEQAQNATLLHTTVDLATATSTIAAGTYTINNIEIGRIDGATATYGQASVKAFNAAQAINRAYTGTLAKLTTQVAGSAITTGLAATESVSFSVNGVAINYTAAANETAAQTATNISTAINSAITDYNNNVGLTPPQQNIPPRMTITALVGNGLNGGDVNSIILKNSNEGDESRIVVADIENDPGLPAFVAEDKLGLTNGTFTADSTHNTGELSLFSTSPITIEGGPDDRYMAELGWASAINYTDKAATAEPAGGTASYNITFELNNIPISVTINDGDSANTIANAAVTAINLQKGDTGVEATVGNGTNGGVLDSVVFSSNTSNIIVKNYTVPAGEADVLGFGDFTKRSVAAADDKANDGKLSFDYSDHGVSASMMGYNYADQLVTDGTSFDIWIYNQDGSLALSQPVNVSIERAYTLHDVVDSINTSINNAINDPTLTVPWVKASVFGNKLSFTPDSNHSFAFKGDTSNFLATAGINTFFTGDSCDNIGVNTVISEDLTKLAAGTINQFGEIFTGDNTNALAVTNIQGNETVFFTGGTTDSLDGHYNSLVAEIGLHSSNITTNLEFNTQVNDQLNKMRDSTSGVSLDEEMANLIKYQHAYSACAKLITTSDEMLQTLLSTI